VTGGVRNGCPCHPFPRPVRQRALLRGRERRRGTTGPRLLPQRSARRAEGSWSGREETPREAPMLSCRTGRGTKQYSPPQADHVDGAAGATRSVARRVFLRARRGSTPAGRRSWVNQRGPRHGCGDTCSGATGRGMRAASPSQRRRRAVARAACGGPPLSTAGGSDRRHRVPRVYVTPGRRRDR
jgi:hypothetical protein